MAVSFTAPPPLDLLSPGPVYAFDPITLHLAARELGDEFKFPSSLAPEPAPVFHGLADVVVHGTDVMVTIDTGSLAWAPEVAPVRDTLVGYDGVERRAVRFARRAIAVIDGNLVTRLPMISTVDEEISVWFRELDALDGHINSYDLLTYATDTMRQWKDSQKYARPIYIPAQ